MASCSGSPPLFSLAQGHVDVKCRFFLEPARGTRLVGRWWSSYSSTSHNLSLSLSARDALWASPNQPWERMAVGRGGRRPPSGIICCDLRENGLSMTRGDDRAAEGSRGIQLYSQIERLITETASQAQDGWRASGDWEEVEGCWVLKPKASNPQAIVHFIGGIFVGAAPQITYGLFLNLLAEKGFLVIATPFASGFDHLAIADEAQFKFDRCIRTLKDTVNGLPTFGVGHSLGAVTHLLIGSRYAVQREGNVLMAFNNKEASSSIPLFSPVIVPMAQSFGPIISQLTSSPAVVRGAEIAMKQLESLNPRIMKQVLPLVEQLPPLYMDLAKGREDFTPKPEETRRLIKSYYGVSRNLLIRFKDDNIDETGTLAQVLSSESAISSQLDMSIRTLPGDHAFPLQQVLPNVPPAMADTVNRGSEFLAGLTAGTPWEAVAKEVGSTFGADSRALRSAPSGEMIALVEAIASWMSSYSSSGPGKRLLPP